MSILFEKWILEKEDSMEKISKIIASVILVGTLCMTNVYAIQAKEEVEIIKNDESGIVDPIVYASTLKAGDSNNDGKLSVEEAKAISSLSIDVLKVASVSLKGIHLLPQLTSIEIYQSEWTAERYTIQNIEELKNTKTITSISIKNAKDIIDFQNMIGENSPVTSLSIQESDLHAITGIENAKNLQTLEISIEDNYDRSMQLDASLLLSSKNTLHMLDVSGWQILHAKKLGELGKLKTLKVSNTKLPSYQFISKLQLQTLEINDNQISNLSFLQTQIDVLHLSMSHNSITDISVLKGLTKLQSIEAINNAIVDISVLKNLALKNGSVNFNTNKIEDLSALNGKTLAFLSLSGNQIVFIDALKTMSVKELFLSNNRITDISSLQGKAFAYLSLDTNEISDISSLKGNTIDTLSVINNQISDISPLQGMKLRRLVLTNNKITDLSPIKDMVTLEEVSVAYNYITTLPDLTKLVNLTDMWTTFYGNTITAEELKAKMPIQLASNEDWILSNQMYVGDDAIIETPEVEEMESATIPATLADKLRLEEASTIKVTLPSPDTVSTIVFQAAKETSKNVQFDITDTNGILQYGWLFHGTDIVNPNMDIDLSISFASKQQKDIEKLTGQTDMLYLSFAHHGTLPGPAAITVRVSDTYLDGDTVYLHYFNEETGTITLAEEGIVVKDGYVTFTIDHCSVYYLSTQKYKQKEVAITPDVDISLQPTPTKVPTVVEPKTIEKAKAPSTGDNTNVVGYSAVGVGALAIIVALTIRKIKRK